MEGLVISHHNPPIRCSHESRLSEANGESLVQLEPMLHNGMSTAAQAGVSESNAKPFSRLPNPIT